MMIKRLLYIFLALFLSFSGMAQQSAAKNRIAVFIPLYLDSAFDGFTYKYGNETLPKYSLSGLDFYHGVSAAIEELKKLKSQNFDVFIYDTKKEGGIEKTLQNIDYLNFSMIIASFNNTAEQTTLSEYAKRKNIPLISATYPNESGLQANPFFIMLNTPLKTHIEGIFKHVSKNYQTAKITYVTRKGTTEDMIEKWFDEASLNGKLLRYKKVELNDNATTASLQAMLDSNAKNVLVFGTLNDAFSYNIVKNLDSLSRYNITVAGMPTWEGVRGFNNKELKKVEIVYSTPYNFDKGSSWYLILTKNYKDKFLSRPSDMYFKGFETMFRFTQLLEKYPTNLINNISDASFNVWNNYSFAPAKIDKNEIAPDYIENRKLYFVVKQNGQVKNIY